MSTVKETADTLAQLIKGKDFDEASAEAHDEKKLTCLVHVYKAHEGVGNTGRWGICFNFKPLEHDEAALADILQNEYGPGDYPVQIKTKVDNRPSILYQKTMYITAPKFKPSAGHDQAADSAQSHDALAPILAQLADGQNRIVEALARRPEPTAAPSAMDVAKDLAVIKDLFADKSPDMMQQFRDFMELKNMLEQETDTSDPLTSAIKHFGPMIATATEELRTRELGKVRRPAAGPAKPTTEQPAATETRRREYTTRDLSAAEIRDLNAHDAAADAVAAAMHDDAGAHDAAAVAAVDAYAAAAEPTVQEIDAAFLNFSTNFMPALKHLVASNAEPKATAEWLVRLVAGNPERIRVVGLVIGDDNMVERIVGFDGEMLAHASWLDLVADWLAHALWPEQNPEPPAPGATQSATTDENGETGTIIDGEADPHPDDSRSHAEIISDAGRIDPSASGDNNDA